MITPIYVRQPNLQGGLNAQKIMDWIIWGDRAEEMKTLEKRKQKKLQRLSNKLIK
jgi:hypothetical protein|tara:strand:+ start:1505 stop:1669 length:165 start_codon:yes stop_codon:yes gene_type:complete